MSDSLNSRQDSQVKPNPEYGNGVFRRRISLFKPDIFQVCAELEDCNHGFRIKLQHNKQSITAITAQAIRHPFNTCPAAIDALQAFVGCSLNTHIKNLRKIVKPEKNCTHLYDLATLAMAHANRDENQRLYDVTVPDEVDGLLTVTVLRDGNEIHRWQIKNKIIITPQHLANRPIMKGFYQWATVAFADDTLEAAEVLQRGYFVSHTRRLDLKHSVGRPATGDNMPHNSCYSYSTNIVENAFQVDDAVRDFTNTPELLLKFV